MKVKLHWGSYNGDYYAKCRCEHCHKESVVKVHDSKYKELEQLVRALACPACGKKWNES